jgi:Uma2 family endonuclease
LEFLWSDKDDYFIGANLTIYYSRQQLKNREFRGPDFFLVKDTQKSPRNSWVVWEEGGRYPNLIIELLSDSTQNVDKGLKKNLYENVFHTPEYFWFSPENLEFEGWKLIGNKYQQITPSPQGWLWSDELGLYLGIHDDKLRYFTTDGELVATPNEAALLERQRAILERERADAEQQLADAERQRADAQQQRADAEQQRADTQQQLADAERQRAILERERADAEQQRANRLAEYLRSQGIDPDNLT